MKNLSLLLLWSSHLLWAQNGVRPDLMDALQSNQKSHFDAGLKHLRSADAAWMNALRKKAYYNAACSFSLAEAHDRAFENLFILTKIGYSNRNQIENEPDLAALHPDPRWAKLLATINPALASTPHGSRVITSDIDLFYRAFDMALKEPAKAATIFQNEYFARGSDGLQDFFIAKIHSVEQFAQTVFKYKDFYASARAAILKTTALKGPIRKYAATFEELYPEAVFPDLYFVVGRLSSNGTISENGLLIGTEQMSKTAQTDTSGWNDWQRQWVMDFGKIPVTVTHELIHSNQNGMKRENTLLCYALFEGSAEFITELITGQTDGDYLEFKGNEQRIWADFKAEMRHDVYDQWIEAQPARPRNALYWAGYIIAKAYYQNAADKKKALSDMLNISNYEAFLAQSGADSFVSTIQ